MFYECITLDLEASRFEELPPFVIDCYDRDEDLIGQSYDYIGRAVIKIDENCSYKVIESKHTINDDGPPEPKWHPFTYHEGGPQCGEVLVSFVICKSPDYNFKIGKSDLKMYGKDKHAIVQFEDCKCEINVLGLRDLQSPGFLPVKKAFIEFGLNSLVPPGDLAHDLRNKLTTPGPLGPNPTINTIISFEVPLPIKDLFTPAMSCKVSDKIFKGLTGQLIGTFNIPLGDILRKIRVNRLM